MSLIRTVMRTIGTVSVLLVAVIAFWGAYVLWKSHQERTSPGVDIETVVEAE